MKFILSVLLISQLASAEIKPLMKEFYSLTDELTPYMIDRSKFMDESNSQKISSLLTDFNQKTKLLKKDKMAQDEDMKFKAKLLAEGLDEAEKSFNSGYKDYSFWVLKASLNNCFSCHTQKSLDDTNYNWSKHFSNDLYAKAEFLFIVRNYSEATPLFEKILAEYPDNKVSIENLESASQKLLYFYMGVSRDDAKALSSFDRVLKNKKLPSSLHNELLAWKKYLNEKKQQISGNLKINSVQSLDSFAKARTKIGDTYKFPGQRAIVDLDTTHYLYQLLEKSKGSDLIPVILYWLAFIEKDYRLSMFDLSAENYLKECMEKYSAQSIAKKCFGLFKEIQVSSYTGSRGTDVPKSVTDQLNSYDALVNPKPMQLQNH